MMSLLTFPKLYERGMKCIRMCFYWKIPAVLHPFIVDLVSYYSGGFYLLSHITSVFHFPWYWSVFVSGGVGFREYCRRQCHVQRLRTQLQYPSTIVNVSGVTQHFKLPQCHMFTWTLWMAWLLPIACSSEFWPDFIMVLPCSGCWPNQLVSQWPGMLCGHCPTSAEAKVHLPTLKRFVL